MTALAADLEKQFGPVSVFRPHRDLRFSTDKRLITSTPAWPRTLSSQAATFTCNWEPTA